MLARCVVVAALLAGAAGCVRAPSRIDTAALVRAQGGVVEARRVLELRTVKDPKDLQARLALAALEEQDGRPAAAMAHLEVVRTTGGPFGARWHPEDRARLGRLLAARGMARVARGAGTAAADLARAVELGAAVDATAIARGTRVKAEALLRHADARERARGQRLIAGLAGGRGAEPAWRGALVGATPAARAEYGAWLWSVGARRAAWTELSAWHAATAAPRDPALQARYTVAHLWWTPPEGKPLPAEELAGPERCAAPGARDCAPAKVVRVE
ncbi:MAG: hypothetical protein KF773_42615, partial [Deltaproteobacteria bacterium]|nr:hypothetical protein [Deltaproteobacteria bacterium]